MKNTIKILSVIFIIAVINSCNDTPNVYLPENASQNDLFCINGIDYPLIAGQHDTVGIVHIQNDASNIYVTYTLTATGCNFGMLHLWIGNDLTNVPQNSRGTPIPGQFCRMSGSGGACFDAAGLTTYTFTVPLTALSITDVTQACNLALYSFTHAEVNCGGSSETAWGGNNGVNIADPGRWYFYAVYNICCDFNPPPSVDICKTAFGKGGWVWTTNNKSNPENLPSLRLTQNRWGWAVNLLVPGTTAYDIWAGAGLNKISNGTKVGTLTINWDGYNAEVTYALFAGFSLSEIHLYADDQRPATTAPGQYGINEAFDPGAATYTINVPLVNINGIDGVWLIAHAVVCGNF